MDHAVVHGKDHVKLALFGEAEVGAEILAVHLDLGLRDNLVGRFHLEVGQGGDEVVENLEVFGGLAALEAR